MHYACVAKSVEVSTRVKNLSWSHHREVAKAVEFSFRNGESTDLPCHSRRRAALPSLLRGRADRTRSGDAAFLLLRVLAELAGI